MQLKILLNQNFFVKNIWKVIGFGIVFTIWAPSYRGGHYLSTNRRTIGELSEMSNLQISITAASVYTVFCILGHVVWNYQDKRKLSKLQKRKAALEKEIATLSD